MSHTVHLCQYEPNGWLAPYVQSFQFYRTFAFDTHPLLFSHFPTGNISVWITLGSAALFSHDHGILPQAAFVGIQDHVHHYQFTKPMEAINILFHPAGVRAFFPYPLSELTNRIVPIDAVWPSAAVQTLAELEGLSLKQRVASLESLLKGRLSAPEQFDTRVQFSSRAIWRMQGQVSFERLEDDVGISSSQLTRLYNAHIGIPPKRFARMVRFYTALRHIRRQPPKSWAAFALEYGYADQAHFIREFRTFAGLPPVEFVKSQINAVFLQDKPPAAE